MRCCTRCVLPALNCPRPRMSADVGLRTRTRRSHYLTNQRNSWPPPGLIPSSTLRLCPVRPALYKPQVGKAEVWGLQPDCTSGPFSPGRAGLGTSRLRRAPRPLRCARCAERCGQHAAIWTRIPDIWAAAGACRSGRRSRGSEAGRRGG